jgi:hypothetical protein
MRGKGGRRVRLTNLQCSCADCLKAGSINFLEPSGPVQSCLGIDLPVYYSYISNNTTEISFGVSVNFINGLRPFSVFNLVWWVNSRLMITVEGMMNVNWKLKSVEWKAMYKLYSAISIQNANSAGKYGVYVISSLNSTWTVVNRLQCKGTERILLK